MTVELRDAVTDALAVLYAGLETFGKPFNAEFVLSYLMGLDGLDFEKGDLEEATRFLLQEGDGKLPAAPVFRAEIMDARRRRCVCLPVRGKDGRSVLIWVPKSIPADRREAEAVRKAKARGLDVLPALARESEGIQTPEEIAAVRELLRGVIDRLEKRQPGFKATPFGRGRLRRIR